MHRVPSSDVVNKEVVETRWVLQEQSETVKARLVMKQFNTWEDESSEFYAGNTNSSFVLFGLGTGSKTSRTGQVTNHYYMSRCSHTALLHADMRDEVCINIKAVTLRLSRGEQLSNVQPFDSERFYKVDTALYGYRCSTRFWKDAVAEAAKSHGLKHQQNRQVSPHGPREFSSVRARCR